MNDFWSKTSLIWNIANLLWWWFKKIEYKDIILPFTVLRRLDCVLEKSKPSVLEMYNKFDKDLNEEWLEPILTKASWFSFYNTSVFDFHKLLNYQEFLTDNCFSYNTWWARWRINQNDEAKYQLYLMVLHCLLVMLEVVKVK